MSRKPLGDNISEQINGQPAVQKLSDAVDRGEEVVPLGDEQFLAQLKSLISQLTPERREQLLNSFAGKPASAAPKTVAQPKRIRIVLQDNENIPPTGLFMCVNGATYIIQTGREVDVPPLLCEVLDQAVTSVPVVDPITKQVKGFRDRLRFPYVRVRGQDELAV